MKKKLFYSFIILILISMNAFSKETCYQFETQHFIVHYFKGVEQTAYKAATIAEEIYGPITSLYQYEPKNKVRLIFKDNEDYANGGAYYFDNKIEISAENLDFVLRGTHFWLRDVITHEFVHIVSLQKAMKLGRRIPGIYFQYFKYEKEKRPDVVRGFPHILGSFPYVTTSFPVWFAEGVAQYQCNTKRYDYRDSHREMIVRDRVLTNNLMSLNEMNTFGKTSIGNESSYNQGFAFVKYLADTYGENKIRLLTARAKKITDFTFEQTMKNIFNRSHNELYNEWHTFLKNKYKEQTDRITTPLQEGIAVEEKGFGNLYPVFSPNGKKIAYVTNGDAPSFGNNSLVIAELKNGIYEKKIIDHDITSSLTWSPDGKYLVYSRRPSLYDLQKPFNDLYLYDIEEDRSYEITRNARLRNPDWRPGSNQLVAVAGHDGNTNLVLIDLNIERIKNSEFENSNKYGFHLIKHSIERYGIVKKEDSDSLKNYHFFHIKSDDWEYITDTYDGRQYFHPRWSPDGKRLITDTSIEFTRNIAEIDIESGKMKLLISGKCDYRNPAWSPDGEDIYFASDSSGIFNIYRLTKEDGKTEVLTNTHGGAFWPNVNRDGQLLFGLYKNQGYSIHILKNAPANSFKQVEAIPGYYQTVLHTEKPVSYWKPGKITKTKPTPSNFMIFPRVLIDYGTFKPGFYVFSNELINRMSFLGSFDMNKDKDIFIFTQFKYDMFKQSVIFEIYNQISHINDKLYIPQHFNYAERNIKFNLLEMIAGFGKIDYFDESSKYISWKINYRYSKYNAVVQPFSVNHYNDPTPIVMLPVPFHYDYLRGHAIEGNIKVKSIKQTLEKGINPQNGYYASLNFGYHNDKFLTAFRESSSNLEQYEKYKYLRGELELEGYLQNPLIPSHTFDAKIQAGFTSTKVDSFFHFFAGGLLGLKGYPFYSIEGRHIAIGSFYYRFPVWRNINKRLGIFYFKNLYAAPFYQVGNAWDDVIPDKEDWLQDVGIQLRLAVNTFYFMPIK
ncbi:MAG: PD40 domain-containing protein, partial [Calditrichia bacterium]|nr:PD40 domain-containing protein [Calditrichia bacterium]